MYIYSQISPRIDAWHLFQMPSISIILKKLKLVYIYRQYLILKVFPYIICDHIKYKPSDSIVVLFECFISYNKLV